MQWEQFFGPGNAIRWDALRGPAGASALEALRPFLALVEQRTTVAALPRVREADGGGGAVRWYVGWREERDARFARDLLQAFLGRSYANMKEPVRALVPKDAVDRSFSEEFSGSAFIVDVSAEHRERARNRLLAMARCLSSRPPRRARRLRSVGRILRDVEFAIQQGDDGSAAVSIEELRSGGHSIHRTLSTFLCVDLRHEGRGRRSLRIRTFGACSSWRRLRRVLEAVIQAAFHNSCVRAAWCRVPLIFSIGWNRAY